MTTVFLSVLLLLSGLANAHGGEEPKVIIEPELNQTVGSNIHQYRFQLFDTVNNKALIESDLELSHERKLHFLAYDPGLQEYQHVHPTFDGVYWTVALQFPASGKYWLWAQGKVINGDPFSTPSRLEVRIGKPAWPAPPRLSDIRSGTDGNSQAVLSNEVLKSGRSAMVNLKLLRTDGSAAQITPYLGALAHVVAVSDDADSLIHVHPMNGSKPNEGMLHVTFPRKGHYRLWIEFIDQNVLRKVSLSVRVL